MAEKQRLILLSVDCSPHSDRALSWYLENLHRPGDKVGVVHVHEPPTMPSTVTMMGPVVLPDEWNEELRASLEASKNCAQKVHAKLKDLGVDAELHLQTSQGGVGKTICDIAERTNAAGVVLGSRGLNVMRRTLLGSVSEYVAAHCHVPVTVTPPAH